jgi:anti-sigma regulatory factor (Ser/Thr protein kinase)
MPTPTGSTTLEILPDDASAVRFARQVVAEVSGISMAALDDAVLAASELVTNAVEHGRPPFVLAVHRYVGGELSVAIADASPRRPRPVATMADSDHIRGRGLSIVAGVASSWGVTDHRADKGKTVWFTVAADRSGTAATHRALPN